MFVLKLTEEQANIVSVACEFYARVKLGQFGEITWHCAQNHCPQNPDETEKAMLDFRKHIYPDLVGIGHSYGIGKFEDADKAFDVHQVIRHITGDHREPFSFYDLPVCQKVENMK